MSYTGQTSNDQTQWRRHRCASAWRPLEVAATILAFVVFWPLGLALLAMKLWQMNANPGSNLATFAQTKAEWARGACKAWRPAQSASMNSFWSAQPRSPRTNNGWNPPSSGNAAFDDWRNGEIARLEEERSKLEAAEREFTQHIDELRRARDREEFERFMAARRSPPPPAPQS